MQHFIYYRFSVCICSPQFFGLHPKNWRLASPTTKIQSIWGKKVFFIHQAGNSKLMPTIGYGTCCRPGARGEESDCCLIFQSNLLEGEIPMMLTITSWPGRFSLRKKQLPDRIFRGILSTLRVADFFWGKCFFFFQFWYCTMVNMFPKASGIPIFSPTNWTGKNAK